MNSLPEQSDMGECTCAFQSASVPPTQQPFCPGHNGPVEALEVTPPEAAKPPLSRNWRVHMEQIPTAELEQHIKEVSPGHFVTALLRRVQQGVSQQQYGFLHETVREALRMQDGFLRQ